MKSIYGDCYSTLGYVPLTFQAHVAHIANFQLDAPKITVDLTGVGVTTVFFAPIGTQQPNSRDQVAFAMGNQHVSQGQVGRSLEMKLDSFNSPFWNAQDEGKVGFLFDVARRSQNYQLQ